MISLNLYHTPAKHDDHETRSSWADASMDVTSSMDSIRPHQETLIRELRKDVKCTIYCTAKVDTAVQKRCMVSSDSGGNSDTE